MIMVSENPPSIEHMVQTIHLDTATDMVSDNPPRIEHMAQTIHLDTTTNMVESDNPPGIEHMTQTIHLDPDEVKQKLGGMSRFRILVTGRSNAGKTTLLQRVCNTTEDPEIHNSNGEKVKYPIVQRHRSLMHVIRSLVKSCAGHERRVKS